MISKNWDERFLKLAEHVASWSKDPSTKVGAIIVQPDRKLVVGMGYNGFARGVADTEDRLNDRAQKLAYVVHAEVNATLMAGDKALGGTLYVWPSFAIPCVCQDCAKTAIQAGIREIVGRHPTPDAEERAKRWGDSLRIAKSMCDEAGVRYRGV